MESGPVLSIPNRPLRRIYHDALYPKFREKGIDVRLLTPIDRLEVGETSSDDGEGMVVALRTGLGERLSFDRYLLALEPEGMGSLLRRSGLLSLVDTLGVDRFRFGAITAIHLWFDGRLIDEPAAVLSAGTGDMDGMGDWLFVPRSQNYWRVDEEGNRNGEEWVYHQVLISGTGKSRSITGDGTESLKEREGRIIEAVWKNLRRLIPTARRLRLGGGIVTTVPSAVLLPTPDLFNHPPVLEGIDGIPRNLTILGNRFTDGWPDTMEGAVRSTRGF